MYTVPLAGLGEGKKGGSDQIRTKVTVEEDSMGECYERERMLEYSFIEHALPQGYTPSVSSTTPCSTPTTTPTPESRDTPPDR